ncbi:MAG: DUF4271 domain-containing protein [Saprospiraceae bacterium]|nr:DUF4271 domain-containing protein [Saprospiraceae bacterium]
MSITNKMRVGFLLFVGLFWLTIAYAQDKNPFELAQPKSKISVETQTLKHTDTSSLGQSTNQPDPSNPFEVIKGEKTQLVSDTNKNVQGIKKAEDLGKEKEIVRDASTQKDTNFYFVTLLTLLLFLTILVSLNRSLLLKINQSLLNENMMKYLHRNQVSNFQFTYLLLYFYFFCNFGMFLFFIFKYLKVMDDYSNVAIYGICLGITCLIYFTKHIVMWILAWVFPVEKEMDQYSFTTQNFNIILGLYLTPVNIFLAFGTTNMFNYLLVFGICLVILFYILRQMRGLMLSSRFLPNNFFHFFIYLCATEIAPILLVAKSIYTF